jgi:hypothetical protein
VYDLSINRVPFCTVTSPFHLYRLLVSPRHMVTGSSGYFRVSNQYWSFSIWRQW